RRLTVLVGEKSSASAGGEAPNFRAIDVSSGENIEAEMLSRGSHSLVFVSPDCTKCVTLVEDLRSAPTTKLVNVVLVCRGNDDSCKAFTQKVLGLKHVFVDADGEIGRRYGVDWLPTAVSVQDGRILGRFQPKAVSEFLV
ncbi:MAG TPA: hypothetical protein VFR18_12355, partial [Terriglobia bacterium]|nr:hypothetical protein [Terriglobia bacterium]